MSLSGLSRLVVAALFLAWGSAVAARDEFGRNRLAIGGLVTGMPVTSMLERRYATVIRQQYDFSCGSAALATLLSSHYGRGIDERAAFIGMWRDGDRTQIQKLGFSLLDMKRFLAALGLPADGYKVTLDQIASTRIPGIALLDVNGYKHFVVVKGLAGDAVLVGDPALGLRRVSRRLFTKQWNGVFFVVNTPPDAAKPGFNRASEFALAPSGRTTLTMEPISQAALALTRPTPGEF